MRATEQGVVRGIAAHFTHGGQTYRLLAYTPQPRFTAFDSVFEHVISSFAPLTDPQILQVQPNRIDIVRIPEPMTLETFSRRYDSVAPLSELALINGVEGGESTFEAGALLKRVVS